jgi:hypothetical protein
MENRDRIIDDEKGKRHSLAETHFSRRLIMGKKAGVVDHVGGGAIKLTKKNSADGQHHFIPVGWVERVDSHVHLTKNSMETEQNWKSDAAACVCSG